MNSVLFPAKETKNFAATGSGRGWCYSEKSLIDLAKEIIVNNGSEKQVADFAIPSPIASFKEFHSNLTSEFNLGHKKAVREWRGMIAAIALQKIKSIEISVKEIPLFKSEDGDIPSDTASIMLDCLAECRESGYIIDENGEPNYKKLTVFCKKDNRGREIPFAMFMPSTGICPFKEYPKDLFAGLEWYDDKEGEWKDFSLPKQDNASDLDATSQKLYLWLKQFNNKIYDSAKTYFNSFAEYLTKDLSKDKSKESGTDDHLFKILSEDKSKAPVPADYENADSLEIFEDLKNICPLSAKAPRNAYSDKILIIIPVGSKSSEGNAYLDSSIKNVFVPQRKKLENNDYFVLPPIHKEVVESFKKGADLKDLIIKPEIDDFSNRIVGFTVKFKLIVDSETMSYSHFWSMNDVVWTDTMPYISIWPFVKFSDDSWKKYSVSVYNSGLDNRGIKGSSKGAVYKPIIDNAQRITGINNNGGIMPMKVDVINKNGDQIFRYSCCSKYTKENDDDVTFDMLESKSIPTALSFSCKISGRDYSLGCWVIKPKEQEIQKGENKSIIAMDFGTTGTNVYIRNMINLVNDKEKDTGHSISILDEYIADIYNPFVEDERNYIQKYYLFGYDTGKLGKIFTYGQNFALSDNRDDGSGKISGIPNVTGRFVKIDEQFLSSHRNYDIKKGLKWQKSSDDNQSLKMATENFVSHILLTALLEAKCNTAKDAEIRISYPQKDVGDVVTKAIDKNYLEEKSGMNITLKGETEAVCAGIYYGTVLENMEKPSIEDGYSIVDIGGGTTDYSFWRGNNPTTDIKNQNSFRYAGNKLVEETISQFIKDADFKAMWLDLPDDEDDSINPFSIYLNDKEKKSDALIYILDRYKKNTERIRNDSSSYKHFLQAIRMKYYALFYLIACHIDEKRKKGDFNLHEKNFTVCLAGCGSKGIEFCKIDDDINFLNNLSYIFRDLLYDPDSNINVMINRPKCDNKEEVVKGLLNLNSIKDIANLSNTSNSNRPRPILRRGGRTVNMNSTATQKTIAVTVKNKDKSAKSQNVDIKQEDVYDTYQALCDYIRELENCAEYDSDHLINKISLGYYNDQDEFVENSEVKDALDFAYSNIKQTVNDYNPDPDTYKETFALAILESMIDSIRDNKDA